MNRIGHKGGTEEHPQKKLHLILQHHATDIVTYILNRPRGRYSEKFYLQFYLVELVELVLVFTHKGPKEDFFCNYIEEKRKIFLFKYPILDTRNSFVLCPLSSSGTLVLPPLDSETGWTGDIWLNRVLVILKNLENSIYLIFGKN